MKTKLNEQVTLVVAKVVAIKVWDRKIPSYYDEEKELTFKEVQLTLDEMLPANTDSGEMNKVGVLWKELKQAIRLQRLGKAMLANLPKLKEDLLNQQVKDDEVNRPDEEFANHIAPMLIGATVQIIYSQEEKEVTLESGATDTEMLYKRALALPMNLKKYGVDKVLDGEVITVPTEYMLKSAIAYFEAQGKDENGEFKFKKQIEQLQDKLAQYMCEGLL